MSSKIDKTQPYASISGDDLGRVYEQNHKFYGADGNEWTDYDPTVAEQQADDDTDDSKLAKPAAVKAPVKAAGRSHKKAPTPIVETPPVPSANADDQLSAQLEGGTD